MACFHGSKTSGYCGTVSLSTIGEASITRNITIRKEEVSNYGCKHTFPFRTIKSYPKVYNPNKYKPSKIYSHSLGVNDSQKINKHELLKKIDRIDHSIMKTEKKLDMLRKSRKEYRKNKPKTGKLVTIKSLSERIYSENKARAEASYKKLREVVSPILDLSGLHITEIAVLKVNTFKFKSFRPFLEEYLRRKKLREAFVETLVMQKEALLRNQWNAHIENLERCDELNQQLMERVQLFEDVHPELKTEREHQEVLRSETVRTRNHIKDYSGYLREKQTSTENALMRAAKIPRLLLCHERQHYVNHNNWQKDMCPPPKAHWTIKDRQIFKERYLEHPKDFSFISSFFKDKTVADCILFYYLTKKSENYKELLCLRDGRRGGRSTKIPSREIPHTSIENSGALPNKDCAGKMS